MALEQEGDLDEALSAARSTTEAMIADRRDADVEAIEAIELVEKKIVELLCGEQIRGLPDLGDGVYGLRIDVEGSSYARLPPDGRVVLVLDRHGVLVAASLRGKHAFVQRAPRGMIRASTLPPYIRAARAALDLHVRAARVRRREFEGITALARRIATAIEDP